MGASDFTYDIAVADVKEAFSQARSDAAHEHGHGGYSGSLAEKNSYVVIQHQPLPVDAAYELASQLMDDHDPRVSDKWGPAGAIPLCAANTSKSSRKVTVKVTVDGEPDWGRRVAAAREAALAKAKPGEIVGNVGPISATPTGKRRVTVTHHGPAKVEVGWVIGYATRQVYATKAKALAALRANPDAQRDRADDGTVEVKPIVVTPNAATRVTVLAPRLVVEAEVGLLVPGGAVTGWLFFGYASS